MKRPFSSSSEASAPKKRRVTVAVADSNKGKRPTVFGYAPVLSVLKLCASELKLELVKIEGTETNEKGKSFSSLKNIAVRWQPEAIDLISSILEMKVRKLLEDCAKMMAGSGRSTLNDKTIATVLSIHGESQVLRGYEDADRIAIKALQTNATGTPAERKTAVLEQVAKAKKTREESDKNREGSAIKRMRRVFTPRVLENLFAVAGVGRSSSAVRHILCNYGCEFLMCMVQRLHPILESQKKCTVTVAYVKVASAASGQAAAPLLGFKTKVHKRVNADRSAAAKAAAQARAATSGTAVVGPPGVAKV
jgi:histone H3/H4